MPGSRPRVEVGWPDYPVPEHIADNALCDPNNGGHHPDTWFPTDRHQQATPILLCRTECPVRTECLQYTLDAYDYEHQPPGIWGGLTEEDRRRILRKRSTHNAALLD